MAPVGNPGKYTTNDNTSYIYSSCVCIMDSFSTELEYQHQAFEYVQVLS
jgi:hypothetical protein